MLLVALRSGDRPGHPTAASEDKQIEKNALKKGKTSACCPFKWVLMLISRPDWAGEGWQKPKHEEPGPARAPCALFPAALPWQCPALLVSHCQPHSQPFPTAFHTPHTTLSGHDVCLRESNFPKRTPEHSWGMQRALPHPWFPWRTWSTTPDTTSACHTLPTTSDNLPPAPELCWVAGPSTPHASRNTLSKPVTSTSTGMDSAGSPKALPFPSSLSQWSTPEYLGKHARMSGLSRYGIHSPMLTLLPQRIAQIYRRDVFSPSLPKFGHFTN